MIQLKSVNHPFRSLAVYQHAVSAIKRAEAMGLLPDKEVIEVLDRQTLTRVLTDIARAGIGRGLFAGLAEPADLDAEHLGKLLEQLNDALEESPAPAHEWAHLVGILGVDQLARLLAVSPSSVRRYKQSARATPDDIAARLHFLALVVGDLAGAYNDIGIRRWFERPRTPLANRAPQEFLRRAWSPHDTGPTKIRDLARGLASAGAT